MIGVITIFAFPYELEDLANTLLNLKKNYVNLVDNVEYKVDITMCLSDEFTNWSESKLPKDYIRERTTELVTCNLYWCKYTLQFDNPSILGSLSQRRWSLNNNQDADFFIWLDCDLYFKDSTLNVMQQCYLDNQGDVIIVPEYMKMWDSSWDVVVNEKYINASFNYRNIIDPYIILNNDSKIHYPEQCNSYKFVGGWFSLISKSLLAKVGIPESFGHYGPDDTYVMYCSYILNNYNNKVIQLKIKNLIVCEMIKYRTNSTIKNYISSVNKKVELRAEAESKFNYEILNFKNKLNESLFL